MKARDVLLEALNHSGLSTAKFARDVLAGREPREVRRWLDGTRPIPRGVVAALRRYVAAKGREDAQEAAQAPRRAIEAVLGPRWVDLEPRSRHSGASRDWPW